MTPHQRRDAKNKRRANRASKSEAKSPPPTPSEKELPDESKSGWVSYSYGLGEPFPGLPSPMEEGGYVLLNRCPPVIVFAVEDPAKAPMILEGSIDFHLYVDFPLICMTVLTPVLEFQRTFWCVSGMNMDPTHNAWLIVPVKAQTGEVLGTRMIGVHPDFAKATAEACNAQAQVSESDPRKTQAERRFLLTMSFDDIIAKSQAHYKQPAH